MKFPLMLNCLFHSEQIPSLRIWLNGNFYCHGCGLKGNVFGFDNLNNTYQINLRKYLEEKGQEVINYEKRT